MPGPHDKIIASAAKAVLGAKFTRKGRSRIWLSDHDWWVTVVEFQPSSWSKGCYLNVAAHWLWTSLGHLSFDYGGRVAEHVQYQSDEQFETEATRLAEIAAREAQRLVLSFPTLNATAEVLLAEAQSSTRHPTIYPGWTAYNAGVALGLTGRTVEASQVFGSILQGSLPPESLLCREARRMARVLDFPCGFEDLVLSLVAAQRTALKFPACEISLSSVTDSTPR